MVTQDWAAILPSDWRDGSFVGRFDLGEGPTPVLVRGGIAYDMAYVAPTVSALLETESPAGGEPLGSLDMLDPSTLLAPIDLQCVKAAGVTFAVSTLERVIEERAGGDLTRAAQIRARLEAALGGSIRSVTPGSPGAAALKQRLIADGLWSQYLEVAIGPDAEIFTKAPVLSSVGAGATIGVRSDSSWNNPEPEVVLVATSSGSVRGATLGNDVNLRDFEGRSALLLGKAKDNNASAALGPLIRLFDAGFSMDDVRSAEVALTVEGTEGYRLSGASSMREISRAPEELMRQALSEHHYPDGLVLFLGTMFAPIDDRDEAGKGFTHRIGDVVTVSSDRLGVLANTVATSRDAPAWSFGITALMTNLARRKLL